MNDNNKKIFVLIISIIMVISSLGIAINYEFTNKNSSNNVPYNVPHAINSNTTFTGNNYGATDSGLTVPLNDIGIQSGYPSSPPNDYSVSGSTLTLNVKCVSGLDVMGIDKVDYSGSSPNVYIYNSTLANLGPDLISLNSNFELNLIHDDISWTNKAYTNTAYTGSNNNYDYNVNISFSKFIAPSGEPRYLGNMNFDNKYYYNNYANFTIPKNYWGNNTVIKNALKNILGSDISKTHKRGSSEDNDTGTSVYVKHNDFAGLGGIEIYGSGNAYFENNLITEQLYWTAYVDLFNNNGYTNVNAVISNNTFHYYGNSALEDYIATDTGNGGGNTYITSGENGNLKNVSLIDNSFVGELFLISENRDQHATFILGNYKYIKGNLFDMTSYFNTGDSISYPLNAYEYYSDTGLSYFEDNLIKNISTIFNEVLGSPKRYSTWGAIVIRGNRATGNLSDVPMAFYKSYTVHYTIIGKQLMYQSGTIRLENSYTSFIANAWHFASKGKYLLTLSVTGLVKNAPFIFYINKTKYASGSYNDTIELNKGNYSLEVYNDAGYTLNKYKTRISLNNNTIENIKFNLIPYTLDGCVCNYV